METWAGVGAWGHLVGSGCKALSERGEVKFGPLLVGVWRWGKGEGWDSSHGAAGDQSAPTHSHKEEEKVGVYPVDFPSAWKRREGGEPARTNRASPPPPRAEPPRLQPRGSERGRHVLFELQ